jgi:hypothetical protein
MTDLPRRILGLSNASQAMQLQDNKFAQGSLAPFHWNREKKQMSGGTFDINKDVLLSVGGDPDF